MCTVIIFVLGLLIGSFLNVCIYRMPKNESIIFPASHCPDCKKSIPWYDNIPIVSYLALGGKCRSCKAGISLRYPLVEALTAAVLTALFVRFGVTPKFFAYSVMSCGLIVSTFIDFEIQEIPDAISIGGTAAGLILAFAFPSVMGGASRPRALLNSLAGLAAGAGSVLILKMAGTLAFREKVKKLGIGSAMGGGDVTLMAMIGSFLGAKLVLFTFFAAPFFGVIPAVIMKLRKGAEIIPYGPFLSMAALAAIFFGNRVLGLLFGGLF